MEYHGYRRTPGCSTDAAARPDNEHRSRTIMHAILPAIVSALLFAHACSMKPHPAMTLDQFRAHTTLKSPVPTVSSSTICTDNNKALLFIPDIHGTILQRCQNSVCTPIYLTPQTAQSHRRTYQALRDKQHVSARMDSIEYPRATCAPSPYTHEGHCLPLPARGPIWNMRVELSKAGYETYGAGYDWRLSTQTLVQSGWADGMNGLLSNMSRAVIVGHGQGCRLGARYLSKVSAGWKAEHVEGLVCIGGVRAVDAHEALANGTGFAIKDGIHELWGAMSERRGGRVDYASMEFELGLSGRGRRKMAVVKGPWDRVGQGVVSAEERRKVWREFEGVREAAKGEGVLVGSDFGRAWCVAKGGCSEWIEGMGEGAGEGDSLAHSVRIGMELVGGIGEGKVGNVEATRDKDSASGRRSRPNFVNLELNLVD